ncbi:MAG: MBL fold metallo-hydrolase [Chloroflexota bacterium]|nr:MBL fold metallo-hydrolase [Chloroflexota bacterium]
MKKIDVLFDDGIYLPALDLWLDAHKPQGRVIVSHGHADHIESHGHILGTPETVRILQHRIQSFAGRVTPLAYGQSLDLPGPTAAQLTLYPAGHCLGSAQTLIEMDNTRICYTGDMKLRPNVAAETGVIVPCDVLIIECTFGEPRYLFPPDAETHAALQAEVEAAYAAGEVPVVLGYALGKAQEALHLLTGWGYPVMCHGAVNNICRIYEECGVHFPGPYTRYVRGEVGDNVLFCPPSVRKHAMLRALDPVHTMLLTGWALHPGAWNIYKDVGRVLPLSDHAGYDDLLRYVKESGAKTIYTVHGGTKFAMDLRERGYDAHFLAGM